MVSLPTLPSICLSANAEQGRKVCEKSEGGVFLWDQYNFLGAFSNIRKHIL